MSWVRIALEVYVDDDVEAPFDYACGTLANELDNNDWFHAYRFIPEEEAE